MTITERLRREDGTSLMELIVGMSIMMIFGSMFTGAIYLMTTTANKAESIVTTSTELSTAFTKLDETVRYAAALSQPGQSSGSPDTRAWYVEMRTTNTGREVCTQIRVDQATRQLQRRSWSVTSSAASGLTAWTPMALGITNGGVSSTSTAPPVPFVLIAASRSVNFQRLTVSLVAEGGRQTTSSSVVTFAAMNGTATTSSAGVCQEVGRP